MRKILNKAESLMMGLLTISIVLQLLGSTIESLYAISLSGLALVFLLFAQVPNDANQSSDEQRGTSDLFANVIIPKILWIGTAIATTGILFFLYHLPGALNLLLSGCGAITVCVAVLIILRLANSQDLKRVIPVLYRAFPALLIAAYIGFRLL